MKVTATVEFYPLKTQHVEPTMIVHGENPVSSMMFKALPAVGHIIESPINTLPAPLYRVAQILHNIHGDITIKVIPV